MKFFLCRILLIFKIDIENLASLLQYFGLIKYYWIIDHLYILCFFLSLSTTLSISLLVCIFMFQVSTSTGVVSHYVSLQVVVPEAFILGSSELHVDMGSVLNLVCIIEKVKNTIIDHFNNHLNCLLFFLSFFLTQEPSTSTICILATKSSYDKLWW